MAEGAPLLREYVGKTCIEGSNPSDSANQPVDCNGFFFFCGSLQTNSRSDDRVAEGAPLLREYVGKTCIKGSNPFRSAKP